MVKEFRWSNTSHISAADRTFYNRSGLELVMQVEREEKAEKRVGGTANSLLQYDR